MMLALLLFGAVVLRDDISIIPPHHRWRYDRFEITEKRLPVDVDCTYRVLDGAKVHLELMTSENLEALRAGERYEVIQSVSGGSLHQELGVPGTFALVLWNDDDAQPARVAFKVALDFSGKSLNLPRTLPVERQVTVILLSLGGFLTILTISARQLMKAMTRRPPPTALTSFQILNEPESTPPIPDREPD